VSLKTPAEIALKMSESSSLRITEIFVSLQGEAATTGLPTTFIRLTGCPLRCRFCDTAYAFSGGSQRSIEGVILEVKQKAVSHICVTGGEPLAQLECHVLLKNLCDDGFLVSLETSGAMDIAMVDSRVSVILDIKTPGSGEAHRNLLDNLKFVQKKDQIKVVITDVSDFRWFELFCETNPKVFDAGNIWISPSYGEVDLQELAGWVIQSQYQFRMQLQLHKQIWGDEIGR
jgi:7-carboxy-7-deazaguanine synthase